MLNTKELKYKIKDKVVGLIAQGQSVEILEQRIEEYKDLDIIWISFNNFDIIETFILNKINKKLQIVFNFASCLPWVETEIQTPWTLKIINRGSLFITNRAYLNLLEKESRFHLKDNIKKILLLENIGKNGYIVEQVTGHYKTNASMGSIINSLVAAEVKKIILFGFDGAKGKRPGQETLDTYYKTKTLSTRRPTDWFTVPHNTHILNLNFLEGYKKVIKEFNLSYIPEILNCSPKSTYTCFKTITYDEVKNYVKGEK